VLAFFTSRLAVGQISNFVAGSWVLYAKLHRSFVFVVIRAQVQGSVGASYEKGGSKEPKTMIQLSINRRPLPGLTTALRIFILSSNRHVQTIIYTRIVGLCNRLTRSDIYTALHLNDHREFKYGKPLQIIETNTFYNPSGKQIDKNIKTFDNNGLLVSEERYDKEGKLKARITYRNDTVRRLKLERMFERWSSLGYSKETAIYSYDERGFLTRTTDVDANGNAFQVSDLVNNEKGHPTELRLYDGKGNIYGKETAEYHYNKNFAVTSVLPNHGRILSTDTLQIGFLSDVNGATDNYNEHGDVLSYTSKNLNGTETLFEMSYEYDSKGNCIDEKIYKVSVKSNGKKKRKLDRHFQKKIIYTQD
jgi:hypothetical protein